MRMSFGRRAMTGGRPGCAAGITWKPASGRRRAGGARDRNFSFAPQRLTVTAGTTITWTNRDDIPHTVVSTTRRFKSKALDTDDRFSFIFTVPGSYDYFCSLHPHMTGTIVVEAAAAGNAP